MRVLISGAGPAGLMLAHCLLSLGKGKFQVTLYDKAQDPREVVKEGMSHRRYSIGLSKRAESCFSLIPGLLGMVKEVTIYAQCVSLFLGFGKGPVTTRLSEKDSLSAWVVDRVSLCCKLLQSLLDTHGHTSLLPKQCQCSGWRRDRKLQRCELPPQNKIQTCACTAIDLHNRVAYFSPQTVPPLSQGLDSRPAGDDSASLDARLQGRRGLQGQW